MGVDKPPFSIVPLPRFFCPGKRHKPIGWKASEIFRENRIYRRNRANRINRENRENRAYRVNRGDRFLPLAFRAGGRWAEQVAHLFSLGFEIARAGLVRDRLNRDALDDSDA